MTGPAPRLLLASGSPRRRQLLSDAGFGFEVVAPEVEEIISANLTVREATSWNALRKGLVVARIHPDRVVLAADTLVALDHSVIGKPADRAEAVETLHRLSGQTHIVVSSVFIGHLRAGKMETFSAISRVVFKKLSDRQIEEYLTLIDPLDKAGAYAAQGEGRMVIEKIIGSESNVIGLPMAETCAALARFAVRA